MNRRKFITDLRNLSLLAVASGVTASTAARFKSTADKAGDGMTQQVDLLKKRMDSMETNQKNLIKAFCVITAISTGIDLSIIV